MVLILVSLLPNNNNNLLKQLMFQLLKFQTQKKLPNISKKKKMLKMLGINLSSNSVQKLINGLVDKSNLEATTLERKITLRYFSVLCKTYCGKEIPGPS
tara:strand:+ start:294 stop:590 length:297 start_codon:yes stop_codon:yes gene_type:complete